MIFAIAFAGLVIGFWGVLDCWKICRYRNLCSSWLCL